MTDFIYKFIDEDGGVRWEEGIQSEEEAVMFMTDMDCVSFTKEEVSKVNYVVGWMYYNDMEDYNDACEYVFNNEVQLENYWESNNCGGHFSCDRMDVYVGGELVDTVMMDERVSCMNGWGEEPNEGDNLSEDWHKV